MIVFKDIFTQDPVFTDAYNFSEIDNSYYVVEGQVVQVSSELDEVAVNASMDDTPQLSYLESNIIADSRLVEIGFKLRDFEYQIKQYIASLLAHVRSHSPSAVEAFKAGSHRFVSIVIDNFDSYRFFGTESDPAATTGLIIPYKQETPQGEEKAGDSFEIIVFKAGVYQEST